jgi:hypothetical protein
MRRVATRDGKVSPTREHLENIFSWDGMTCRDCGVTMHWLKEEGPRAQQLTLQHYRSGSMGFVCLSCNTRHAAMPGDSYCDLPKDHKRCPKCEQIKPLSEFYRDASKAKTEFLALQQGAAGSAVAAVGAITARSRHRHLRRWRAHDHPAANAGAADGDSAISRRFLCDLPGAVADVRPGERAEHADGDRAGVRLRFDFQERVRGSAVTFAAALAAFQADRQAQVNEVLARLSAFEPIPREEVQRMESLAVDQAFHRQASVPAVGNIAQELTHDLRREEIDRAQFDTTLDALAAKLPCPGVSALTYAGEYLNDYVLAECNAPEFSDADTNTMAATLLALCAEFRCLFAYFNLNSICAAVHSARAPSIRYADEEY